MEEQKAIVEGDGDMGGTMRLGLYPADLVAGSLVAEAYGATRVEERHRHRYEVNNAYRGELELAGMVFSGLSPDRELVEFVELPRETHPYYVSTQAHPELRSRPTGPHPLFVGLVAAALEPPARAAAAGRRDRPAPYPGRGNRLMTEALDSSAPEIGDSEMSWPVVASTTLFDGR